MVVQEPGRDQKSARLHLQSVVRAMATLDCLSLHPDGLTAKAIAAELGFTLGTTYHLLRTLIATGHATQDPLGRLFQLGPSIPRLHHGFLAALRPRAELLPFVDALRDATGETAHLCRLHGNQVVVAAIAVGDRDGAVPGGYVGIGGPVHSVAVGRVLLAWLPEQQLAAFLTESNLAVPRPFPSGDTAKVRAELTRIRAQGYAIDRGEGRPSVVGCVAAAIADADGVRREALSLLVPLHRFVRDEDALAAAVVAIAGAASTVAAVSRVEDVPDGADKTLQRSAMAAEWEAVAQASLLSPRAIPSRARMAAGSQRHEGRGG
jgi:IclR family acetate operon transcriptional repressor